MRTSSPRVAGLRVLVLVLFGSAIAPPRAHATEVPATERPRMVSVGADGVETELPLVRGQFHCEVRGPIAQVAVTQSFHNASDQPIEAVYVFPLPERSAVGGMTMHLGTRTIRAVIRKRAEARAEYADAVRAGKTAALLEQERPNVFTQSVANILPGEDIDVELTYDVLLEPDEDQYELALPTVVGPRYIPGEPIAKVQAGGGTAADTDRVPDASRISPPIAAPGHSTGATYAIDLDLDAGLPITDVSSPTHDLVVDQLADGHERVTLAAGDMAADKDLVVRWRVVVKSTALAVLADRTGGVGHLAVVIQPPPTAAVAADPRELELVVDTSGSMDGEPLALVKRAMRRALDGLDPVDAFRIINFSTDVSGFRDGAVVPATAANLRDARSWVNALTTGGGTEMLQGIRAALPGRPAGGRTRYVVFMTDGYIGNEQEILEAVADLRDPMTHLFSFGVGSSVNRYLLDELARVGDGVAGTMLLDEDPAVQIDRFFDRVAAPALSDIAVEWSGVDVEDPTPAALGAVFAGRPVVIAARYKRGGSGTLTVRGRRGGQALELHIPVALPDGAGDGPVLGRLWARRRMAELSGPGRSDPAAAEREITELGLAYSLMSPYTSFVAVENRRRTDRPAVQVQVPVDLPEGVSVRAGAAGGELIEITGSAPIIDTGSTTQGVTIDQSYLSSIPLPGRTYMAALGSVAGASSLENAYYVDGINTTGLSFGPLGRWRVSLDATGGYDLHGDRALAGVSPSLERYLGQGIAVGLGGGLWRLDDRSLGSVLATISRWSILRLFDVRLALGLAFTGADLGPAWQLRFAAPLPIGGTVRPELTLSLDSLMPNEDRVLAGTFGVGLRF